jgi:DNA-binding transcriptional ArsR family regulator
MIQTSQSSDAVQGTFAALSDQTRRSLVARLARLGPVSMSELCAGLPISRQAVAKHVAVLEEAGLVRSERRGRERQVRFTPAPLEEATRWIASIELEWDARLQALERYLAESSDLS